MTDLADRLAALRDLVDAGVADAIHDLGCASDDEVVETARLAGGLLRCVESLLVETVIAVQERSDLADREQRLTTTRGCRSVAELLQRVTRASAATTARWERAASALRPGRALDGAVTPCLLPAMRGALQAGAAGVDHVFAVAAALGPLARHTSRAGLDAADEELAAAASVDGADAVRLQAQVWAAVLDQDGTEPREERALRRRSLVLGRQDDGLVPVRGLLLTEVAAQLQRIFDAIDAPAAQPGGVRFVEAGASALIERSDDRRREQRQHDALATALGAAARSGELPTIGGAAPTVVLHVEACDLAGGGWAWTEAGNPVPADAARHSACAGVVQRVATDDSGRIVRLGTEERVFNRYQRRAIALRDGGCIIPGCGVPAGWCEIHHVTDHALGGPTHTHNGVLLCWFHHRFLDRTGWAVRTTRGVPEARAPLWIDPDRQWRVATSSPLRLKRRILRT